MKKCIISIIIIFCLAVNVLPAAAGEEGPVSASFSTTVAPVTNGITIYEAGTSIVVTGFTPQHSYDIKISINDNDGIGDLKQLKVKLWYDSFGNRASESYFTPIAANNISSQEFTWDRSTNAVSHTNITGSTWEYPSSQGTPADTFLSDPENISFDFVFTVKIGKVAQQTKNAARWQVGVLTTDTTDYSTFKAYTDNGAPGLMMDWYGEVSVDPVTVDWGSVPLNMQFDNDLAVKTLGTDEKVKYISNGRHATGIKASKTWTTDESKSLTLAATTIKENTFALKAWYEALEDPLEGGTILREDGNSADIATDQAATDEEGTEFANNRLYLALANKIDDPGEYTGSIYYTIHN